VKFSPGELCWEDGLHTFVQNLLVAGMDMDVSMSDKNITELEWKKFSKGKGKGYKDGAFVKALAALELGKTPEAKLAALDAIEKEGDALRKANKADKDLGGYLDDAEKAAGKERKLQEAEAKKAAKQSASEEDEDDSPAALTAKMIPLLRQVRKGDVMKVMVAVTGKEVAVLVSKKPIGPPKRKLLTDYLGLSGGVKFAVGECIWEENAHTFVLSTQAAGLAKKIKAALYKQVEQRFKVRVRGEDPNDIDDDGEPPEDEGAEGESAQAEGKAEVKPDTPPESTIPPAPPLPTGEPTAQQQTAPVSDEAAAFNTRLAALMPKVKEAIIAAGPSATDIKLKVSEAGVFARKKEFGQANALLDQAEELLAGGGKTVDPATAFNARLAALMPQVKDAITLLGPNANDVKLRVSQAGVAARNKEFEPANRLLDDVEGALETLTLAIRQARLYQERLAEIEPRYLAALKTNPAEATRMRAVFGYQGEQAGAYQHAKALNALNQLDKLMGGPGNAEIPVAPPITSESKGEEEETEGSERGEDDEGSEDGKEEGREEGREEEGEDGGTTATSDNGEKGYKGIVAYRTSLIELRRAVASAEGRIAALVKAIPSALPDEADLAESLAESMRESSQELLDLVDDAMNASDNKDTPITRALRARLDALIAQVATDPVIKHVDSNPFGVSTDIGTTLGDALKGVLVKLPVAA